MSKADAVALEYAADGEGKEAGKEAEEDELLSTRCRRRIRVPLGGMRGRAVGTVP